MSVAILLCFRGPPPPLGKEGGREGGREDEGFAALVLLGRNGIGEAEVEVYGTATTRRAQVGTGLVLPVRNWKARRSVC